MIIGELQSAGGQRLVQIAGLDPSPARRFTLTDPRRDPPSRYWPR